MHCELHPFGWDEIELLELPKPGEPASCTLSLAAPLYEEQYLGGGKWFANELAGVSGRIFIDDTGSNFHETVKASIRLDAPQVPANWTGVWRTLSYKETILKLGRGLSAGSVRRIALRSDRLEVDASVTAMALGRAEWPSLNDPRNNRSIFQARYELFWRLVGPEISCISKPRRSDPDERIRNVGGINPDGSRWKHTLNEAIALIKQGHSFYVEQPAGDRVRVLIVRSARGYEYLRTETDYDLPNNLLSLPECP